MLPGFFVSVGGSCGVFENFDDAFRTCKKSN